MNEGRIIDFAEFAGVLKRIKRSGWVERKIPNPESVADHSFRATILGMVVSDLEKLDTEKVVRMLLLHDIEESVTGDIMGVVKMGMNRDELRKKSTEAMEKILSSLPAELNERYFSVWNEMEDCLTNEAKLCKDIDKLEMMMQVVDYENEDESNLEKLRVFWDEKVKSINEPRRIDSVIKIYEKLKNQRVKR